jgi:dTDP-4-dehydrorhamnose reductase
MTVVQPLHKFAPVLLIGIGGMLWRAWDRFLGERGIPRESPDLNRLDLTRPETIAASVTDRFQLVVNCSGFTDVDGAEARQELARQINGAGVGEVARRCAQTGATFIHYSTDYVFAGNLDRPYPVDAAPDSINAYGQSKALGEQLVRDAGCRHLLIRSSWLYAPWGNNFVRTIIRNARQKPTLKVVDDQRGRPTSCEHLVRTTAALLERDATGIWHVCDGGDCTWFEFARHIVELARCSAQVNPCTTAEFPRKARRPAYSVLDLSTTEALLGNMPPWRDNLADVIGRLEPIP